MSDVTVTAVSESRGREKIHPITGEPYRIFPTEHGLLFDQATTVTLTDADGETITAKETRGVTFTPGRFIEFMVA